MPNYDLSCTNCSVVVERFFLLRDFEKTSQVECEKCGKLMGLKVGFSTDRSRFREFVSKDLLLSGDSVKITSYAHMKKVMKENKMDHASRGVGMPGCET